jgi:transcriptional regulator with XRE-family HTH domain
MTAQELIDFRARMGWSQAELARQLEFSQSRVSDYELGKTRGKPPRPAPIPKVVELACRWLEEHVGPLSDEAWLRLLGDTSHLPPAPPLSDEAMTRESIYDDIG